MTNNEQERRCKSCGKILIDEKTFWCRRCILEGRNKAAKVGGVLLGIGTTVLSAVALGNKNTDGEA